MNYYVEYKYLNLLSIRLEKFKQKNNELWNCRCPYCGDSSKKKSKARGYFFVYEQKILYKCHNCSLSLSLSSVIKDIAPDLHKDMVIELLSNKKSTKDVPSQKDTNESGKIIDSIKVIEMLQPISESELASNYLFNKRMIPDNRMLDFMFCDNVQKFIDKLGIDKRGIESPAIAILCIVDKKISAIQFRMLEGEMRYLTLKIDKTLPTFFGLNSCSDTSETISLVEGPFDSTFVNNCVACTTLPQLKDVEELRSRGFAKFRFIYDNDYITNKQVMKTMRLVIDAGYDVVIYDKRFGYKDLNEAVQNGFKRLNSYLDSRTFSGARALLELSMGMK